MNDQTGSSEVRSPHSARPIFRRIAYAILALEIACLLGLFGCKHKTTTLPQGYSCVNQACNAAVGVFRGTSANDPILGFQSSIYLPAASGLSGGTASGPPVTAGGYLRNSVALNAGPNAGFVEAGYVIQGGTNLAMCGQGGNYYFWTDYSNGSSLVVHCTAAIPAQDFDHYVDVRILNTANSGTTPAFLVSIRNQGTNLEPCSDGSPCLEQLWFPNSGSFATAVFGQTLFGTSGAFADSALFINNSYQNASGPEHITFQTADGEASFDNPPLGEWITWPSQPVGANGGAYHTFCCQNTTVFPGSLNFGNLPMHSTAGSQTVTITNTSTTATMNIASIAITGAKSGDFTKNNSGCGSTLGPQSTCSITISFTPSTAGREDATLTVTDSGGSGSGTDTASLFGYGH